VTITTLTLTNPGAETGDTTGWTSRSGGVPGVVSSPVHAGSWAFVSTLSGATAKWDQQVAVPTGLETTVDAGTAYAQGRVWMVGSAGDTDNAALYLEFYAADGTTLLGTFQTAAQDPASYTQVKITTSIPKLSRFIRIGTTGTRVTGTDLSVYFDDFELDMSDSGAVDFAPYYARATAISAEVLRSGLPASRVTAFSAEVLRSGLPAARVTSVGIELLRSISNAPIVPGPRRKDYMDSVP
jgi:hypothetical protein